MRQLASVQIVESLAPIEGADRIEAARVLGWTVVVKKGEFAPGDRCVFFEIDAVLPDGAPWAEFMRPRKFRVKTCKLRKVLSQGLALPVEIDPVCSVADVGADVSNAICVKKYEAPEEGDGNGALCSVRAGDFPSQIPKTDETRLQGVIACLDEMRWLPAVATVKCDGSSGTFLRDADGFKVCSRNRQIAESDCSWWAVAKRYELEGKIPDGIAVQGEVCGPGIQRNRLMLTEHDLFVFDVYDFKAGRYYSHDECASFCAIHGLRMVPIAKHWGSFDEPLGSLLDLAKGKYTGTKNRREGIVVRPCDLVYSERLHGRLSFKVLNNDFLLKDED